MKHLFAIDFKGIFRGLLFSVLEAALVFCLFFVAYSLVFNVVTSNPEKVKGILEKSSLYSDLPPVLYDQTTQEREGGLLEIPLKDPAVRRIALEVYDPSFARASIENLIDGLYGWLDGTSQEPQILIDLSVQNKEFADKLGKYASKKASGLPPCSLEDRMSLNEVNIFKTKCWPADISPETAGKEVEKIIAGADDSILNTRLTAKDLKITGEEPLHEQFSGLPQSFSLAKTFPLVLFVLALVFAGAIIHFSKDRISGLKRISLTVLLAGILIVLLPTIFTYGAESLLNSISGDDNATDIAKAIFKEFMNEASKIYYTVGSLLVLIAVGLYIYIRKVQSNTDKLPKIKG